MKKSILVISIICFFLTSCINIFNKEEKSGGNGSGQNTPVTKEENGTAVFVNKSKFAVNVYKNLNPYNDEPFCVVPANQSLSIETVESSDQELGDVFYFEYLIKIGNADFPYWTKEASSGYKSAAIKRKQSTEIEIDEINKCESKSAYLLIENNSTSNIRVNNANTPLKPYAAKDALINNKGGCGVYEVSPLKFGESSDINLGYLDGVKIKVDVTNEIALPVGNDDVVAGNIYTISVNTDKGVSSASLKAITPFNIDTQNKIWSFDDEFFDTDFSVCMRPSVDGKSTLIMGTPKVDYSVFGLGRIDEYGKIKYDTNNEFISLGYSDNSSNKRVILYSEVIDFIELSDGSIAFVVNRCSTPESNIDSNGYLIEESYYYDYVVARYNFKERKRLWSCILHDMTFRNDSKNKLIAIDDNRFILLGAEHKMSTGEDDQEINQYAYKLVLVDGTNCNNENRTAEQTVISSFDFGSYDNYLGDTGTERVLTSAYYDGTDVYFCGYENWNSPIADGSNKRNGYKTDHVGRIWKASLSSIIGKENIFANDIYHHNNCLFFSIDGYKKQNSKNNYVVCGEYYDDGMLKGCYVSNTLIENPGENVVIAEPVLYIPEKQHCWFNQVCQYSDKIVFCGKAADSFDGETEPLPFVVAYDSKGNKLWENLSFTDYTSALNIIPNTIGTYMLQLEGKNGIIHYVNADLLGNEKK